MTQYFTILTRQWLQLDVLEEYTWSCSSDATNYKQIVERKRIYKFLFGLNNVFEDVRGRTMSTRPLSSLREVFSLVRREESRKKLISGSSNSNTTIESSALVVRGPQTQGADSNQKKQGKPWCDHCQKSDHT